MMQEQLEEEINKEIIDKIKASISKQPVFTLHNQSRFQNQDCIYLAKRLQLHHCISDEPFKKESFEYLLVDCFARRGIHAKRNSDPTYPGQDIIVNGENWSCKTETSSKIKPSHINITKFMECAWQKDFSKKEDYIKTAIPRIINHLSKYETILTMRYFQNRDYEIVEIPKSLIEVARQCDLQNMGDFTGRRGITIYCEGDRKGMKIVFDGSDDKIKISSIPVSKCIKHITFSCRNHISE